MEQQHIGFIFKICIIGIIFGLLFYFIPTQKQSLKDTTIFSIIIMLALFIILNQTYKEPFEQNLIQQPNNTINGIVKDVVSIYSETPKSNGEIELDEIIKKVIGAYETKSQETQLNKQQQTPVTVNVVSKSETFGGHATNIANTKDTASNTKNIAKKETQYSKADDVINDELPYTDYNHLPMAESYKTTDFEYGDSYLPPEKWYPTSPFPPVCVTNKRCPVCPVYTTGTPVDVKEWNASRRITPPDNIKIDYITDKLNSGN